jgi:hypothetical protein
LSCLYFWNARIHQVADVARAVIELKYSPRVYCVIAKVISIVPVITLDESAGLSFPLMVGMRAKMKIICPVVNT